MPRRNGFRRWNRNGWNGWNVVTVGSSQVHWNVDNSLDIVLGLVIFIYFSLFNNLAAYDTLATPIVMNIYNWNLLDTCLMYYALLSRWMCHRWICISFVSFVSFALLSVLTNHFDDFAIFFTHLLIQIAGLLVLLPLWDKATPLWR